MDYTDQLNTIIAQQETITLILENIILIVMIIAGLEMFKFIWGKIRIFERVDKL